MVKILDETDMPVEVSISDLKPGQLGKVVFPPAEDILLDCDVTTFGDVRQPIFVIGVNPHYLFHGLAQQIIYYAVILNNGQYVSNSAWKIIPYPTDATITINKQ